jgi:hypothetical protein
MRLNVREDVIPVWLQPTVLEHNVRVALVNKRLIEWISGVNDRRSWVLCILTRYDQVRYSISHQTVTANDVPLVGTSIDNFLDRYIQSTIKTVGKQG